jgi:O-methyltransferase involved in polyketide biosynthesis
VVILGAGFDSRACRLAAPQGCTVFEVDQPTTQAVKRERSARLNGSASASIRHVAVDCEHDDLRDSLMQCGYRPKAPAICVDAFLSERGFSLLSDTSTAEAGRAYFRPRGRPERGSALYRVASSAVA